MHPGPILHHVACALGVAFLLLRAARGLRAAARAGATALFVLVAAALAVVFGEDMFGAMRLLSWALFVYLPALGVGFALLPRAQTRRARAPWLVGAAALAGVALDAFVVEPRWLEVTRVAVASPALARTLRFVVLTDVQYDTFGEYERAVFRRAMAERPDVILMPGDYVQVYDASRAAVVAATRAFLREIQFGAPLGVFAVQGNVEPREWPRELFDGLPVRTFPESGQLAGEGFVVTGLTLRDSFDRHLRIAPAPGVFHVALGHAPDFALGDVAADLLVAGHTHGGQVRLPFIGPLMTLSAVPRAWAAGTTRLAGGRTLVVSRGTGMERGFAPRLRFLCRPQIVVIDALPGAGVTARANAARLSVDPAAM